MRLDKFLCDSLGVTRKEATQILKSKTVTVNEVMQKSGATKVTEECVVEWQGNELRVQGPRYIMVYKPEGFVCSHEDSSNRTVFDLLDEIKMDKLHFAGRLDVDTTGLVLVTDDGQWSHRITSPKHKCEKMYRVWLVDPVEDDYVEKFKEGIQLKSEDGLTLPAHLEVRAEREVLLTIHEGKYHQVKRMFAALGNKVEALHRERIGEIEMDESLDLGEYRYLTQEEIDSIWK
ncbi:16S rRNA pseudouridine(516) synthase RsuA [Vibrio sp. D404a]|uniref:16S rRNA pseudouridine(516) synthase RsuA n=1 Tax=unclassified Vibrio TaxID=2614977 RepID=UPI0025525BF7|nr:MULTISPECIES: 16S rRNA pseudouridine(516) synthase RsuA [unclassified Vibrio]MDK9738935.1 16S rRNA pseudouridine(516) synthase RsuA [Vibrio sp. D404a]MDK9799856.1 16S rRNA pseudouridine(516) synthase RsuA [Vibrio sp. D449a]